MTERFVICDKGTVEASLVPHRLFDRPGMCPPGAYETLLVRGGKPKDWDLHWDRLRRGCDFIGAPIAELQNSVTASAVNELARRQNLIEVDARLRIEVFREEHLLETGTSVRFLAALWPVLSTSGEPIRVAVGQSRRQHGDPRYNHKLLGRSYVEEELDAAALKHCPDVIFLNDRGQLCEGAYSNLWLAMGDTLITPPISSPCLPGVTRAKVIEAARAKGLNLDERPLSLDDLPGADAMFLSSSIRGIQAVSSVEDDTVFPRSKELAESITASLVDTVI